MNELCLAGIRCPKCKQEEKFQIECTTMLDVTDGGMDDPTSAGWLDGSYIECGCGHHGTVADFTVENWPIDTDHPAMVGEKLYFTDSRRIQGVDLSGWYTATVLHPARVGQPYEKDALVSLENPEWSTAATPLELSRKLPGKSVTGTTTYTAFCHADNGIGKIWSQVLEVAKQENALEEIELAKREARLLCANDRHGEDEVANDPVLLESVVCMALIAGAENVRHFSDAHIPRE